MLKIMRNYMYSGIKETTLKQELIDEISHKELKNIKNELPEEAQTVEVIEYIISEMQQRLKESRAVL